MSAPAEATIDIVPIPLLNDNYAYLLVSPARGEAVVVDPSEAAPVHDFLAARGLRLAAIWCTHHHFDHTGGVMGLCSAHPGVEVVGSAYDLAAGRIAGQTRGVREGDELALGDSTLHVLDMPGHTLGAVAYVGAGHAFTGDTLFLAGCGRLFEGTPAQLHDSLLRLAALPDGTRLWVGHEYTERNLAFARDVEPGNTALAERVARERTRRAAGRPTVPGRVDEERATNPFLRTHAPEVLAFARAHGAANADPVEVFAAVRRAKDRA
jgi:hydroxyacylglutathione hydrolase